MRFRYVQSYGRFGATVTPYGRPTLRQGDRGPDVADLQEMLNAAIGTDLTMDGIFGPMTVDAVRRFQTLHQLLPSGVVDVTTWTELGQPASGQVLVPISGPTPKPSPIVTAPAGSGVLGSISGFISDPMNLAALAIGGGLLAYFAFRK